MRPSVQGPQAKTSVGPGLGAVLLHLPRESERIELVALLGVLGYEAVELGHANGLDEILPRLHPRALLVDLADDVPTGLSLCRAVRERTAPGVAVVLALLADPSVAESAEVAAAGLDDFILKPVQPAELAARLAMQIQRRDSRGVAPAAAEEPAATAIDVFRSVSATLDSDQVLMTVVRKVAEVTEAARCSVLLIDRAANLGFVLATYENPSAKDLVVELSRYPEIGKALETRDAVSIAELALDPISSGVREQVLPLGSASVLVVPILWEEEVLGTVLLHARRAQRPFSIEEVAFCKVVANASLNAIRNANLYRSVRDEKKRLEELVITDPLTGVFNRTYLEARLLEEFDRAQRYEQQFAFIMIDVDGFKRINDTYGHVVGDHVLRQLAESIRQESRKSDLVSRYGGEEFAILLPGTDSEGACHQGERLRAALERLTYRGLPAHEHVTVSIGVAACPHETVDTAGDLVVAADRALYRAKREGKNKVCCSP